MPLHTRTKKHNEKAALLNQRKGQPRGEHILLAGERQSCALRRDHKGRERGRQRQAKARQGFVKRHSSPKAADKNFRKRMIFWPKKTPTRDF